MDLMLDGMMPMSNSPLFFVDQLDGYPAKSIQVPLFI
jgi:hypothetical protein